MYKSQYHLKLKSIIFKPGTGATLKIPNLLTDSQPLLIFTVGTKVDDCGRSVFHDSITGILTPNPTRPYYGGALEKIAKIQVDMKSGFRQNRRCLGKKENNVLETINQLLSSIGIAGTWSADSTNGDFTLGIYIKCDNC